MRRLHEAYHQKRRELWKNQSWISHHDIAPTHINSMLVCEFLAKNKTVIMPQSPYSPELDPAGFLLPKMKTPMKGKRFATIEDITEKSKQKLLTIPKCALQKCFGN